MGRMMVDDDDDDDHYHHHEFDDYDVHDSSHP